MCKGIFFNMITTIYQQFLTSSGISTDTRKIKNGVIFFALKGDNFDGNTYAKLALEKGAKLAVIDNEEYAIPNKTIVVKDCLTALQQLANHHRKQLDIPVIGLTGSNGKTTTKELIHTVLSKKHKTAATVGNLNNHIGVPLTLLSMDKTTEIGVVEMGANHLGEIALLCEIAEPNYGYITNFGKAHLEGFGSEEGVLKAKSELYDFLRKTNGRAIINTDDQKQVQQAIGIESYTFGSQPNNNCVVKLNTLENLASVQLKDVLIQSNLIGIYNAINIACAISIGQLFNVPVEDIKEAITSYIPSNNRSQIIHKEGKTIILDAYNANPTSMEAALLNFSQMPALHKVAFLGDMFELGKSAPLEHQHIAELAISLGINVIFLGNNFKKTIPQPKAEYFTNFEELNESGIPLDIQAILPDSHILIKGSRGMALERILPLLD